MANQWQPPRDQMLTELNVLSEALPKCSELTGSCHVMS